MKKIILVFSLLLNIIFLVELGLRKMNEPTYRYGILKENVEVGIFNQSGIIFNLPAGITVMDVAPSGFAAFDQFENARFSLVVTSDRYDLVDYSLSKNERKKYSNYYSADSNLKK